MAGICTNSVRDGGVGCNHLTLTVDVDGATYTVKSGEHDADWNAALTTAEVQAMLRLLARWWKGKGSDLSAFIGRVLCGEEATNVKRYDFVAPGSAVTKTNIGSTYVDVLLGANGCRQLVDFTGCTEFRVIMNANLVGTGPFGARIVRDSDNAVLYENASIALTGERELDTDWQPLPAAAVGLTIGRLQMKSATAADDPIVRRCQMFVR